MRVVQEQVMGIISLIGLCIALPTTLSMIIDAFNPQIPTNEICKTDLVGLSGYKMVSYYFTTLIFYCGL